MRAIAPALALIATFASVGPAADKAPAKPPANAPATAPAAKKAPAAPDLLKGPVDPYEPTAERGRFFQAAGVDNELAAKEFAAARGKAGSFVRMFDRWEAVVAFDKDHNKTLDWFEADAYRQNVRGRVLKAFDKNNDGRLTGDERQKANAMLASGRLPAGPAGSRARPGAGREANWMRQRMTQQRQALLQRFDADKDGRIAEAERRAMIEAARAEAEKEMRDYRQRQWDADGDGQLSEEESKAMAAAAAEQKAQAERWQRERELRRWDKNEDGELDEEETAAMNAEKARWQRGGDEWRDRWEARQYDLNADGKLSDDERLLAEAARARREVYQREQMAGPPGQRDRQQWQQVIQQWRARHFDDDGDGRLSRDEEEQVKQFEGRMRDMRRGFRNRFADRDGDGQVSEEERAANREEWKKAGWKVFTKAFRYMDADGNGQISPAERGSFQNRFRAGMTQYIDRFTERFDADRNGRLGPKERDTLLGGVRRDFDARIRRFDADRDGRLNVDETIRLMEDFVQELGIKPSAPPDAEPPPNPQAR